MSQPVRAAQSKVQLRELMRGLLGGRGGKTSSSISTGSSTGSSTGIVEAAGIVETAETESLLCTDPPGLTNSNAIYSSARHDASDALPVPDLVPVSFSSQLQVKTLLTDTDSDEAALGSASPMITCVEGTITTTTIPTTTIGTTEETTTEETTNIGTNIGTTTLSLPNDDVAASNVPVISVNPSPSDIVVDRTSTTTNNSNRSAADEPSANLPGQTQSPLYQTNCESLEQCPPSSPLHDGPLTLLDAQHSSRLIDNGLLLPPLDTSDPSGISDYYSHDDVQSCTPSLPHPDPLLSDKDRVVSVHTTDDPISDLSIVDSSNTIINVDGSKDNSNSSSNNNSNSSSIGSLFEGSSWAAEPSLSTALYNQEEKVEASASKSIASTTDKNQSSSVMQLEHLASADISLCSDLLQPSLPLKLFDSPRLPHESLPLLPETHSDLTLCKRSEVTVLQAECSTTVHAAKDTPPVHADSDSTLHPIESSDCHTSNSSPGPASSDTKLHDQLQELQKLHMHQQEQLQQRQKQRQRLRIQKELLQKQIQMQIHEVERVQLQMEKQQTAVGTGDSEEKDQSTHTDEEANNLSKESDELKGVPQQHVHKDTEKDQEQKQGCSLPAAGPTLDDIDAETHSFNNDTINADESHHSCLNNSSIDDSKKILTNSTTESPVQRIKGTPRQRTPSHVTGSIRLAPLLRDLSYLTKCIEKHSSAHIFLEPVDPVRHCCPDYSEIIKHPMDMSTISKKLDAGEYHSGMDPRNSANQDTIVANYARDVVLMLSNCWEYNPRGHFAYDSALHVAQFFDDQIRNLFGSVEVDWLRHTVMVLGRTTDGAGGGGDGGDDEGGRLISSDRPRQRRLSRGVSRFVPPPVRPNSPPPPPWRGGLTAVFIPPPPWRKEITTLTPSTTTRSHKSKQKSSSKNAHHRSSVYVFDSHCEDSDYSINNDGASPDSYTDAFFHTPSTAIGSNRKRSLEVRSVSTPMLESAKRRRSYPRPLPLSSSQNNRSFSRSRTDLFSLNASGHHSKKNNSSNNNGSRSHNALMKHRLELADQLAMLRSCVQNVTSQLDYLERIQDRTLDIGSKRKRKNASGNDYSSSGGGIATDDDVDENPLVEIDDEPEVEDSNDDDYDYNAEAVREEAYKQRRIELQSQKKRPRRSLSSTSKRSGAPRLAQGDMPNYDDLDSDEVYPFGNTDMSSMMSLYSTGLLDTTPSAWRAPKSRRRKSRAASSGSLATNGSVSSGSHQMSNTTPPTRRNTASSLTEKVSSYQSPSPSKTALAAAREKRASKRAVVMERICECCESNDTPMWRRGPSGASTLCNMCGVQWQSGLQLVTPNGTLLSPPSITESATYEFETLYYGDNRPIYQPVLASAEAVLAAATASSLTLHEQKRHIATVLSGDDLPVHHLKSVIDIIRDWMPLSVDDAEIELDIEAMDAQLVCTLFDYISRVAELPCLTRSAAGDGGSTPATDIATTTATATASGGGSNSKGDKGCLDGKGNTEMPTTGGKGPQVYDLIAMGNEVQNDGHSSSSSDNDSNDDGSRSDQDASSDSA
ncbi:hypothetical protein BASA61_001239 [Batrachochytrium salamandrivorans]|nr:hypothetical protein BASA61_001239 [Batrachochytrium salamandrivorans]